MTDSIGPIVYAIIGILYAIVESDMLDLDIEKLPRGQKILVTLQLITHYLRIVLVSPMYMFEDLLVFIDNYLYTPDEEDEGEESDDE